MAAVRNSHSNNSYSNPNHNRTPTVKSQIALVTGFDVEMVCTYIFSRQLYDLLVQRGNLKGGGKQCLGGGGGSIVLAPGYEHENRIERYPSLRYIT